MITGRAVTKTFGGHRILQGVDLDIAAGERVALLGLNGAGKTTLMRCMLGLVPFEGALNVAGAEVRSDGRAARAAIGYVPQRPPHFDGTLEEVVAFYAALRGVRVARVRERMAELGLDPAAHAGKPVRALSGGMLQKVLLALALASEVPLLLLDEPTANLDPRARRDFLRALRALDPSMTIFLASHQLGDVEAVADRILVLHDGRIAFDGDLTGLWRDVGAALTLWVEVPEEHRDDARAHLHDHYELPSVISNGHALGVRVPRGRRADVVVALRDAGIPVQDFWTEAPPLDQLLEGAVARGRRQGS
jgi:ABC-type multidrug transport system ATPase subunit